MKPLLNVAAGESAAAKTAEQEVTGEVLAIRGGRPLTGRVEVKGAKNLVTKAMVAALLGETTSTLRDVPDISDVQVVRSLLEVHGVRVWDGEEEGTIHLDPSGAVAAHFDQLIGTLSRALGLTVFLVTHDLDSLYALCDRVAVLADGKVIVVDTLEVVERHPHPWVQECFRGPRGRAAAAARSG